MPFSLPDVGYRFYWAGKHWEVVAHDEVRGEPVLRVKSLHTGKRLKVPIYWRLIEGRALRVTP